MNRSIHTWRTQSLWLVLFSLAFCSGAESGGGKKATPDASTRLSKEILHATGINAGLCVLLACPDGDLAADLTNGGKMVVQSLALTDDEMHVARKVLQQRGIYGLASVDRITKADHLPYADHLVNLLVCDLDALAGKGPARAEMLRVLAPHGVAYFKENGKWTKEIKPMPSGLDGWTHFYHGPNGNPVSDDEQVGPPTGLQWLAGVSTMGADPTTGCRLAGGRVVYEWVGPRHDRKAPPPPYLVCRDASAAWCCGRGLPASIPTRLAPWC